MQDWNVSTLPEGDQIKMSERQVKPDADAFEFALPVSSAFAFHTDDGRNAHWRHVSRLTRPINGVTRASRAGNARRYECSL